MIKAIFFDIDGTLVSFKTHEVPASTVESLTRLRAKGIKIFIATGRQFQSINNIGNLQFDGYITVNGSYCLAGKEKVIYKHAIPPEDIHALIHYEETIEKFPCALVQEKDICINYMNETVDKVFEMLKFPSVPVCSLRSKMNKEIFQLIAFMTKEQQKGVISALTHCEATSWNPLFFDIIPSGSGKHIGMDKILDYFGISLHETMAFGDGGNDISMLQHAAIGVAMGNANEEVKEMADYITSSVEEDGIFKALKHYEVI